MCLYLQQLDPEQLQRKERERYRTHKLEGEEPHGVLDRTNTSYHWRCSSMLSLPVPLLVPAAVAPSFWIPRPAHVEAHDLEQSLQVRGGR